MIGGERVTDKMVRTFRRVCALANYKGKALGLREQHIYQRLEDGSYELRIRMIPVNKDSVVSSVDGIIVNRTRGVLRI